MWKRSLLLQISLFIVLSAIGRYAHADDNVCVINNSSYDVTFHALGQGDLHVAAKGGDQNQCWHFHTSPVGGVSYSIRVVAKKPSIVDEIPSFGFFDPTISAGYFYLGTNVFDHWNPNSNRCGQRVCAWHTDKTDVWRLYIIDKP
ncbi:MAG: hypothetical protein AB1832_16960 [Pseudomonadota bacterium]